VDSKEIEMYWEAEYQEEGTEDPGNILGISDHPHCPPNDRCIPEYMMGQMIRLKGTMI
jgi:hypothetical protein